jgi:hypothetical protein
MYINRKILKSTIQRYHLIISDKILEMVSFKLFFTLRLKLLLFESILKIILFSFCIFNREKIGKIKDKLHNNK